ncbi:MAG: ribbon-helix-helix domain-containing protein [Candidatus Thermoplasmatota archaeon]|nr:ribbon-helix-helix domain-containing protein [Candidatus Thermoplasmatota archaeon]MED6313036.1 ribbon-helix-helix domain-containing protein [Candidatus Thermoplasmatota archaeon]
MAGQSPMISLRIPEDYLLELERRVGFDGMRNKSDVIREAIRRFLATPAIPSGIRIEVELGPDLSVRLDDFCRIHGEQPDVVLRYAAREHIARSSADDATVDAALRKRLDELRARFDDESTEQ